MIRRAHVVAALAAATGLCAAMAACSACGKEKAGGVDPKVAAALDAALVARTVVPADATAHEMRNVAMWTAAREGGEEELASLAVHEGAAGLVEAAADAQLRPTALRAMAFARGWSHLPFLSTVAAGPDEDDARAALASVVELAARPRRSEDVEDVDELREGCAQLLVVARDVARSRERRIPAVRALRMMPCPKQDLPADLDAK